MIGPVRFLLDVNFSMCRFPTSTTHLMLNEDGKPSFRVAAYEIQAKLNGLHDYMFPLLPGQVDQVTNLKTL